MVKMRHFMPVAALLVMGMATSAYAQLSCSVASTPVSRATATGHTEQAGDLIFNCTGGGGATTAATITVAYGVTITNNTTHPPTRPIAISGQTGSFVGAGSPTVTDATISNATGQIVVNVPAQGAAATGSFSLTGVLVSLAGTNFTNLEVTVSVSPGNNVLIVAGQNVATVITSIQPGINVTTAPPALLANTQNALYFSTSTTTAVPAVPARGSFTIVVTENYIDMFREQAQFAGATDDTRLAFTFSGLPTGSMLTGCGATMNLASSGAATATVSVSSTTVTPSTAGGAPGPTLNVTIDGGQLANQSQIEQIRLTCTGFSVNLATTTQPFQGPITATVTLARTGDALSNTGGVLTNITTSNTGHVPRYQSNPISIGTVLAFTPNTTTMIIPFALGNPSLTSPAGTFDTGIVVANTTGETVGGTGIFPTGGAQAQGGTITFNFFPNTGTAADRFSITTSSIASGASFISNVSEMLRTAGRSAAFSGYIIAVANFTNAHGMAFVYGGSAADRITSATDVMTISPPVISGRSIFAGLTGVEPTSK